MNNFLEETLVKLKQHGKTPKDVLWVGYRQVVNYVDVPWKGTHFSWAEFEQRANKDYEDSFESFEIYPGLIIVGEDWWLERDDENAQEWWAYKEMPLKPVMRCREIVLFTDEAEKVLERISRTDR